MDQQRNDLPEETGEEQVHSDAQTEAKNSWQLQKESWYDKVPLTVKQLDIIINVCIGALILVFIAIAMDAMGVF